MHKTRTIKGQVDFVLADKLLGALGLINPMLTGLISGPLVLYGRGNLGKLAQEYCKAIGLPVMAHIEREERADTGATVAVCVVNSPYVPIETELFERGFANVVPFYDIAEQNKHRHPLSNGWHLGSLSPNVNYVALNWSDDTSRAHHLQFLAWHKAREEWVFEEAPVFTQDRYFIPEVSTVLTCTETFVDVGACFGEVIKKFCHKVGGYYDKVIPIEADPYNCDILRENVPFDPLNYIISDFADTKTFHKGLGYCSQLSQTGDWNVKTTPLDDFTNLKPTFIKIHIEGHELPALKGAKRMLVENRPIIAVTAYHNEDGVWKIPMWLMTELENYNFHFRLHGWCGTGAVVYAIPRERYESTCRATH